MSTQTRIGVRIDTAGHTSRVDFTEDSLAALQAAVSGDIEAIMIGDELTMFANENGIAQFGVLTRNTAAERILATSGTGWVSANRPPVVNSALRCRVATPKPKRP